jgi:predicted phosphodiesterase
MTSAPQTQPPSTLSAKKRLPRWPLVVALPLLVGGAWAYFDRLYQPRLLTGPMVQLPAPGRAAIVWQVAAILPADSTVRAGRPGSLRPYAAQTSTAGFISGEFETDGQTTLAYELENGGLFGRAIRTGEGTARLPAPPGDSFRFLAFGDSGNGSRTQRNLAERMMAASPDLIIHSGDLIYPDGAAADYRRNFFDPYRELLARVPFMPCLGNHDVATDKGQPFLDVFILPENGPPGIQPERNYWFDFGDARFVALDTNRAQKKGAVTESAMREAVAPWLRDALQSSDRRWKFVYFHHPPYTGGTHPAAEQDFVREIFVPVFDACGVDMVFCGHNHLYERTRPIRGDRAVPPGQGTVYIVTGAGGASRYSEVEPIPPYIEKYNAEVFSFTQVDLSPTTLELKQIDENGNVIDSLTITKPDRPATGKDAS